MLFLNLEESTTFYVWLFKHIGYQGKMFFLNCSVLNNTYYQQQINCSYISWHTYTSPVDQIILLLLVIE